MLGAVRPYLRNSPEAVFVIQGLLEKDTSEKPKKALLSDLKCILSWYQKNTGESFTLNRFMTSDIINYKKYCTEERKYSTSTTNRKLINIKNFCNMAVQEGKLSLNLAKNIKLLPLQPLAPKSLPKFVEIVLYPSLPTKEVAPR